MRKLFVLIAAVAFLVAFTAPAFAAEWSFYGSTRLLTEWNNLSGAASDTNNSDLDLTWDIQGNSRFGANVKAGDISGQVEFGMDGGGGGSNNASTRVIWGEYDFGGWKLGIGQTYSPMNFFISNQIGGGDTDMLPFGGVFSGRNPMLRFRFGQLDIALVEPDDGAFNDTGDCIIDTDVILPRLEARYGLNMGAFYLEFGGGVQTYDVVGTKNLGTANEREGDDTDIMSWLGYVGAKYNAGAFYFGANAYYGQNTGDMTLNFGRQAADEAVILCKKDGERPDVNDTDVYGLLGVVAFTANDMLRFEAGAGYVNADNNEYDDDDETIAMYVQATINIAKGIFVVPEVGWIDLDNDSDGDSQGGLTYYAAKWQINF